MVEQPSPGNLLLVTTAEMFTPLAHSVPALESLDNVTHINERQHSEQISISHTTFGDISHKIHNQGMNDARSSMSALECG